MDGDHELDRAVFPTHVGVFLPDEKVEERIKCLPHARGGVSMAGTFYTSRALSSPRTWGCFLQRFRLLRVRWVFPTHVGVFPKERKKWTIPYCLPHARGGVSADWAYEWIQKESSPRTWGCFYGGGLIRET